MFGYVRPLVGEMKVRENEMFRSIYCGLCQSMGRHTGCTSTMTLSYDFVFLCVFRAALSGIHFQPEPHRCGVHPFTRKQIAAENEVFAYASGAAALLTYAKLQDDIADEHGIRRAVSRSLRPLARIIRKRAQDFGPLDNRIHESLQHLSELEKAQCASIDQPAACFGTLLADLFSYGYTNEDTIGIARDAGHAVGQFIYVIDAADDAAEDAKDGKYNPILRLYGDDILETRNTADRHGKRSEKLCLRRDIAESIYIAALASLQRLSKAVEKIDFSVCQSETEGIIRNTVYLGMPAELRRVLALV